MQRINEIKSWFFEKINTISQTNQKREEIQINKIRDKKVFFKTTNTTEMQSIIKKYSENVYFNKLENLKKWINT
jgi:hypothetical protein